MKYILSLLSFLIIGMSSWAQIHNRSTVHIRLSDGDPFLITLNDRDFKKVNTKLTIGDLPGKRQYIQVYKYRAYKDGKGGKAELVYSGNFKVKPGSTYDAIVDVQNHKFLIKDLQQASTSNNYRAPSPAKAPNANDNVILESTDIPKYLQRLKNSMDQTKEDSKKLSLASDYVTSNSVSTSDIKHIANWIMFDDNKLALVKKAYYQISDSQNIATLSSIFTLESTKSDFNKFIQTKQ